MKALAILVLLTGVAHADEDFGDGTVIFARGTSLYRVDAKGKNETEVAQLADKTQVRALRTDANGSVLLADLAGKWAWMPLDGSTTKLTDLPCADGPAQLAEDGACVLCRAAQGSVIVNLKTMKSFPVDIPTPGTRLTGDGAERRMVWADTNGVWSAPPGQVAKKVQVSPEAPLRGFLPSPDGKRAVGVYTDQIYTDARHQKGADVLMSFQLDNKGAKRKSIQNGVALDWSHDSEWVLVQDGASACIMRAEGGQYKCWRGYTAASLSSDGRWGLVLGNRDGSKKQSHTKPKPTGNEDTPSDEPAEDVSVPLPSGPLALYRTRLEGAYTDSPTLLVKIVDGAAVWVPKTP